MQLHYTKQTLYKQVDILRKQIGIDYSEYPVKVIERCLDNPVYTVDITPLHTNGLQGILVVQDGRKHIVLNSKRSRSEQNFFCMHEVIHGYLHTGLCGGHFNCYESVRQNQNKFFEWHTNEGAAEFLVPHKEFIPKLLSCWSPGSLHAIPLGMRERLADEFFVSERVIFNRIENLKYEITQVCNGVKLDDVVLLSANQQKNLGISVRSLNEGVCTSSAEQFYRRAGNF